MGQLLIILGLTFACETIISLTGLPLPGSVVGMVILFILLQTKAIKLEKVDDGGGVLLKYLTIMFVPLGVGIYQYVDLIKDSAFQLLVLLVTTTVLVMLASGFMVQLLVGKERKKDVV